MTITSHTNQRYQRGDVVLVLFPNSDLHSAKRRPALIIQADHLQTGLPQVIVAMISSQVSRVNHPSRIFVHYASLQRIQAGLLTDSVVMTDNVATVLYTAIDRRIGSLPMDEIDSALKHTLGL